MVKVEKTVLVPHTAESMFRLVDDVEQYPNFLPWCGGVIIHQKDEVSTHATISINYHGVKQSFSTKNEKDYPHSMVMHLKDGPFKHFLGQWQFTPLGNDGCKISFKLEYEFSNLIFSSIISPVFHQIANTFVDCFVKRADEVL
jgi:ribosome-associated toxin RatA of RatAB toxin-antitoxin module